MKLSIVDRRRSLVEVPLANTFIGGVATALPTAAALASKLGILESDISYFNVDNSDIQARIDKDYSIPLDGFLTPLATYYKCTEGRCKNIGFRAFNLNTLQFAYFPKATVSGQAFQNNYTLKAAYLTGAKFKIGDALGNDFVFSNTHATLKVYAHSNLQTNNAGLPDGDLSAVITNGGSVVYGDNYNILRKPANITDLTVSAVYSTSVKLEWTPPQSINPIKYYEIYMDGVLKTTSNTLPAYITNLTNLATHDFAIKAVDEFFNKSEISNTVTQQINGAGREWMNNLVSYYDFNGDVLDNFGENDGVATSITYVPGKSGNAAIFNGTTSKSTVNLSGITSNKISIVMWVKLPAHSPTNTAKTGLIDINTADFATHYPYTGGTIYMSVLTGNRKTIGAGVIADRTQWHMIAVTANKDTNVWKFYQNKTLVTTSTVGTFFLRSASTLGKSLGAFFMDGMMDSTPVFNKDLSQTEIDEIFDILNSGAELV